MPNNPQASQPLHATPPSHPLLPCIPRHRRFFRIIHYNRECAIDLPRERARKIGEQELDERRQARGRGSRRKIQAVVSRRRLGRQRSVNYEEGSSRVSRFAFRATRLSAGSMRNYRPRAETGARRPFRGMRDRLGHAYCAARCHALALIIGIVVPAGTAFLHLLLIRGMSASGSGTGSFCGRADTRL